MPAVLLTNTTPRPAGPSRADARVRADLQLCAGHLCEFGVGSLEDTPLCRRCRLDAREIGSAR
jgi:hypothetical protein